MSGGGPFPPCFDSVGCCFFFKARLHLYLAGSGTPLLSGVHGHVGVWQPCLLHWERGGGHGLLLNPTGPETTINLSACLELPYMNIARKQVLVLMNFRFGLLFFEPLTVRVCGGHCRLWPVWVMGTSPAPQFLVKHILKGDPKRLSQVIFSGGNKKNPRSAITQWFLRSLYRAVLVFW